MAIKKEMPKQAFPFFIVRLELLEKQRGRSVGYESHDEAGADDAERHREERAARLHVEQRRYGFSFSVHINNTNLSVAMITEKAWMVTGKLRRCRM